MINKVISAICTALYEEFGDDYEIYKESIEQGLNEPCFFVQSIAPSTIPEIKNRRKKSFQFMIQYFPESQEPYAEINAVIERLNDTLELIRVEDDLIRGIFGNADTVDKVLNYEITYDFFMVQNTELDPMEELEQHHNVKG